MLRAYDEAYTQSSVWLPPLVQVLIFSQMTKMLDLLHYWLEARGFSPCRIDGSVPWRERQARPAAAVYPLACLVSASRRPCLARTTASCAQHVRVQIRAEECSEFLGASN